MSGQQRLGLREVSGQLEVTEHVSVSVWLQNLGSSQHAGLPASSTGNRMPPWTSPTWAPVNLHTMGL